jgi:hypothetical protein
MAVKPGGRRLLRETINEAAVGIIQRSGRT